MTTETGRESAGTRVRRARLDPEPPWWYRDQISCLQAGFAALLARAGRDPLAVLGSAWEFRATPGDVRHEEYYLPCAVPGDLGRSLAPYHELSSRWHSRGPEHDDDPLRGPAEHIERGEPVIAAVDNYYLPFRPAFGDVHAAHLIIVYGFDYERGTVHVSDAMPPAFRGEIPMEAFLRSWGSVNPRDEQDAFFSDAPVGHRYLEVSLGEPGPELTPGLLGRYIQRNVDGFLDTGPEAGKERLGLSGLSAFLDELLDLAEAADPAVLRDLYPLGWAMQAQSALHGELLRVLGALWALPDLARAGHAVESVSDTWTGLRMTGAHHYGAPAAASPDLRRHAAALRRRYEDAVETLQDALTATGVDS